MRPAEPAVSRVMSERARPGHGGRANLPPPRNEREPPAAAMAAQSAQPVLDAAAMLDLSGALHASPRFRESATALATGIATLLGVDRVCIGMRDDGYAEVAAVSGNVDFEPRGEIFRVIAAAMDEAIEQAAVLQHPAPAQQRPRLTLAQAELARRGAGAACTLPLVDNGKAIGAITLECAVASLPDAHRLAWCEDLVRLLAPVLALKHDAGMGWPGRLRRGLRGAAAGVCGPGSIAVKLAVLCGLAGLFALCTWPVEYRVSAPARLEGAIQRALVAPADGYLQQVYVKPGDAVTAGQVVADLAAQDLELERRKWASEAAQNENSSRAALARGERTQYVVAQGKAAEAQAQLQLVEQQLARGRIRAPFAGIVIKGDLSQMLGAPVQRGDVLLTVAPAQGFRLIVEVDERDIANVRVGAAGHAALAASPGEPLRFQVVRVTPVATSKEGRNFYEVEARPADTAAALRPGLQGVAKIIAADRPLAWIWGHRLYDWARLAVWSHGA